MKISRVKHRHMYESFLNVLTLNTILIEHSIKPSEVSVNRLKLH